MENWFFTHFLSDLPGPLSVYTALENNTIYLQHFLGFRVEESSPPPAGAPDKNSKNKPKGDQMHTTCSSPIKANIIK